MPSASKPNTTATWRQLAFAVGLAGAVAAAGFAPAAQAAMRCGSRVVSVGDHKLEVLKKCGQPALIEPLGVGHVTYWPHLTHGHRKPYTVYAEIEEWTYNFGPRRFMRLVRFADSKVTRIIVLDYGY